MLSTAFFWTYILQMKKKEKKKGHNLDEQPNGQEAERRKFNQVFLEAYRARKNTDMVFFIMAEQWMGQ